MDLGENFSCFGSSTCLHSSLPHSDPHLMFQAWMLSSSVLPVTCQSLPCLLRGAAEEEGGCLINAHVSCELDPHVLSLCDRVSSTPA